MGTLDRDGAGRFLPDMCNTFGATLDESFDGGITAFLLFRLLFVSSLSVILSLLLVPFVGDADNDGDMDSGELLLL